MTTQFIVEGMTCSACEKLIGLKVGRIEDVADVSILLSTGHLSIESARTILLEEVQEALHGTNFTVREC